MNASTVNILSIIMLIFAAWAAVEIVTNVTGNEIPPVTGMETNSDSDDAQRVNSGVIVGLGAVAGTLGFTLQLLIPRVESEEDDSTEEKGSIEEEEDVPKDEGEDSPDDENSEDEEKTSVNKKKF